MTENAPLICDERIAEGFPDGSVDMATNFEIKDALHWGEAPIQARMDAT